MPKSNTKADFVSFRPGDLSAELLKRANAADMSTAAKGLLKATFAMIRAETARLQKSFSPAEMQAIVAALYDQPCEAEHVIGRIRDAIDDESRFVEAIICRFRVDRNTLREKVRALGPASTFAIADSIGQLRRMPMPEVLGLNGMPSLDALRLVGLVAPQGPAAWGFCVVRLSNYSCEEFILHHDPATLNLQRWSWPIEKLAIRLVEFSRLTFEGATGPEGDIVGYSLCYRLSLETGLRYFRVEESSDGKSASVIEIPRDALINDLHDGSLHHGSSNAIVLAGLNAPDYAATSTEERSTSDPADRPRAAPRKRNVKPPSKP